MRNLRRNLFIFLYVIYQEILFMIFTKGNFENIFLKILFSIQFSMLIGITFCFKQKINKVLGGILLIISSVFFGGYFAYYKTFGSAISLYSISKGFEVMQFGSSILNILLSSWYVIILILLPTILYFIFLRKISIEKNTKKDVMLFFTIFILFYLVCTLVINLDKEDRIYSKKNIYYNINNGTENLSNFGVLTTLRLDIQRTIFPFKEKLLYEYEDASGNIKVLNTEEYNMIDIDFDKLIESENNEEIKELHNYFKNQEPTKKNEYTGKYEGKNLIVIVGESFSSLAIREDITPTLYKLANQGIQFENFYTPLFPVSTADGQYLTDTGILPAEGVWSIEEVEGKSYPYSYGNVFKSLGYNTYAYHNYNYDYYQRQIYFDVMGYDTYLANGNGLEERMDFSKFPSSDLDMIKSTMQDYINDDNFIAYYLTMSGHIEYNQNHAIVQKNWDKVKKLPYSEKAKAYLATQIELDKTVEELIKTLEENEKLDDTVIVISGDHYPYGLNESQIKELSPYNMNDYNFERFHMPLIIYNSEDEDVKITKYGSSLDILPTVLNLFGINYDSRLLMGKDILSDAKPFIIFSDRSFITNEGRYDSDIERFIPINKNISIDKSYIKNMENKMYLKYRSSRLILENDYYSYIKSYLY